MLVVALNEKSDISTPLNFTLPLKMAAIIIEAHIAQRKEPHLNRLYFVFCKEPLSMIAIQGRLMQLLNF